MDKRISEINNLITSGNFNLALTKINFLLRKKLIPELLFTRGIIFLNSNRLNESEKDLNLYLKYFPNSSETYCNLGIIYKQLNLVNEAILSFKKSIILNNQLLESYLNLAELYYSTCNYFDAIDTLNESLIINPTFEKTFQILASCHREINNFNEFNKYILKAIECNSFNYENYYQLGFSYIWLDQKNSAIDSFKKCININKTYGPAIYMLNKITKYTDKNYLDLLKTDVNNIESESYILLAKSEYAFIRKKFNDFFYYLDLANNKFNPIQYSSAHDIDLFKKIKNFYQLVISINHHFHFDDTFKPIFIIGMPRTGSSLCEQILAAHPDIYCGGEINFLHENLKSLIKTNNFNQEFIVNHLQIIQKQYISFCKKVNNNKFFIDKLPLNFLWIGIIKKLFPNAVFIHTTRNKIDTCMSLYRTFFGKGSLQFSYSKKNINIFYNLYLEAIAFWQENDFSLVEFKYDQFIANPSFFASSLFNMLNLDFRDDYLQIHNSSRPVKTASFLQIKDRIYKNSFDWNLFPSMISDFL